VAPTSSNVFRADLSGDFLECKTHPFLILGSFPVIGRHGSSLLTGLATTFFFLVGTEFARRKYVPRTKGHTSAWRQMNKGYKSGDKNNRPTFVTSHRDDIAFKTPRHNIPFTLVDGEWGPAVVASVLIRLSLQKRV
jgi:hypothetical protein